MTYVKLLAAVAVALVVGLLVASWAAAAEPVVALISEDGTRVLADPDKVTLSWSALRLLPDAEAAEPEQCERLKACAARYQRKCLATPTPLPSLTPRPTQVPLPCESVGDRWTQTFREGEEHLYCFYVAAGPTPPPGGFGKASVAVSSQNHGNASCAYAIAQLQSPMGEVANSDGTQVGGSILRTAQNVPGTWYFYVKALSIEKPECATWTFTATR